MVNSPLIRPYFLEGVALGGVPYIPMKQIWGSRDAISAKHPTRAEAMLQGLNPQLTSEYGE